MQKPTNTRVLLHRMAIRRTAHAVYDTKYHLIWTPKYRKLIKREDIRGRVKKVFLEIAEHRGFGIQELKKDLWGGEFWEDGYFMRTVGERVTADLVKRYIKYHGDEVHGKQLKLF